LLKLSFISSRKKTMYKRSKKDSYRKRIEEMIVGGSQKRSRESSSNNSNVANIGDDTASTIDCSYDSHDNVGDINNSSSGDINNGSSGDTNIRIQRWNPISTRIEGIHNYLEANKINLITKIIVTCIIGQLTNLEKKIDNITQDIVEMKEELKELKKLKEAQQPDQSFLMVSIF
jgi:hypothetical protein